MTNKYLEKIASNITLDGPKDEAGGHAKNVRMTGEEYGKYRKEYKKNYSAGGHLGSIVSNAALDGIGGYAVGKMIHPKLGHLGATIGTYIGGERGSKSYTENAKAKSLDKVYT